MTQLRTIRGFSCVWVWCLCLYHRWSGWMFMCVHTCSCTCACGEGQRATMGSGIAYSSCPLRCSCLSYSVLSQQDGASLLHYLQFTTGQYMVQRKALILPIFQDLETWKKTPWILKPMSSWEHMAGMSNSKETWIWHPCSHLPMDGRKQNPNMSNLVPGNMLLLFLSENNALLEQAHRLSLIL